MSELKLVIAGAEALQARGEPGLVATLVAVRGSSYRRPGGAAPDRRRRGGGGR